MLEFLTFFITVLVGVLARSIGLVRAFLWAKYVLFLCLPVSAIRGIYAVGFR